MYKLSEQQRAVHRITCANYRKANKEKLRQYRQLYRQKNRSRLLAIAAAHRYVYNALQTGELSKPDNCSSCKKKTKVIHGHHTNYSPETRLDVVWLCPVCHLAVHKKGA